MAKRKKKVEEEKEDTFTPLFLALSIILLAFFIMLNSIAELKEDRVTRAIRSFQESRAGLGIFGAGVGLTIKDPSVGGQHQSSNQMGMVHQKLQHSMAKWGKEFGWADAYEDERKMVISLSEIAIFEEGQIALHPRVFPLLDELGNLIDRIGIPVTIQGNSDNSPSGRGTTNWEISAERAAKVARYLIQGVGVKPELVDAEAFAEFRPIADNGTKQGREKNRRVDLVFYKRKMLQ